MKTRTQELSATRPRDKDVALTGIVLPTAHASDRQMCSCIPIPLQWIKEKLSNAQTMLFDGALQTASRAPTDGVRVSEGHLHKAHHVKMNNLPRS